MQPAHRLRHQLGPDAELRHLPRGERIAVVPTRVRIHLGALSNTVPLTRRVGMRPRELENPPRHVGTFRRIASERETTRRQAALQAQRRATPRRAAREAGGPLTRAAQPPPPPPVPCTPDVPPPPPPRQR